MSNRQYITFHYKNLLISKYKTRYPDDIMELGNRLIMSGLKNNRKLQQQIPIMKGYLDIFHYRRLNKLKVSSEDHRHFVGCFLGLMKLNQLLEDDATGFIITKT